MKHWNVLAERIADDNKTRVMLFAQTATEVEAEKILTHLADVIRLAGIHEMEEVGTIVGAGIMEV